MRLLNSDGTYYEPNHEDPVPVGTDQFYDRSLKLWTVFAIDKNGFQVGETHYCRVKADLADTQQFALYVLRKKD